MYRVMLWGVGDGYNVYMGMIRLMLLQLQIIILGV